jgi:hypothetical protein
MEEKYFFWQTTTTNLYVHIYKLTIPFSQLHQLIQGRALRGKGDPVELVRATLLGKSLILKLWSLYCSSLQPSQSSTEDCCLLVMVSPAESNNICLQIISQTCLMRPSKGTVKYDHIRQVGT